MHKNKFEMNCNLNVNSKTLKFLEENTWEYICYLEIGKDRLFIRGTWIFILLSDL